MATTYPDEAGAVAFETLSGTAAEVRKKLGSAGDDQVVALTLEHGTPKLRQALAQAVTLITPLILARLVRRDQETLDKLIDALVPQVPPPQHVVAEARMNAEARTEVLSSAEWLTAAQLSELAGFSGRNASAQPNKWKREGKIFAFRQQGVDYYPGYALDADAGYRPLKGLAPVLNRFRNDLEDWDIAIWFASVNSFLGGVRPMDLLKRDPERVLAAAEDEIDGVLHG
ncbi:hypothetical protein [Novosphingobium album (ex Liu et al. 2023)]|uniref:DUF2384 domain-containing protein n=1 Tax=Novosphingobium album (ex Liu et al. 2023) TaxID=3031130 RepID=A0ABT5WWI5_9SPHN|nr:hypothetical protein [Novosphingobium album (ex Liu et al. 2023)]MDE8654265.1 hypothetical protein [Novosphingobium album (ex Liu et al. 2023)]